MAKIPNLVLFLRILASFALISFPVNVSGEPPLLFTFGDSSYDVGNTKFFSSTLDPATTFPYDESVNDPTGRWCDGRIVPDFVLFKQARARKVAVQNLAPVGCLPIVRQEYKTGENCMEMINFMVNTHNERLPNVLYSVSVVCRPLLYSLFDFNGAILQIERINEPSRHGYTDTTTSCCGIGSRNTYGCGYSNVHSKLCSYQKSFLFFDGRHNTEKTNEDIANLFYSGDKNVVSPVNIRDLAGDSLTNLPAQEI